jgi:hypothetical protein
LGLEEGRGGDCGDDGKADELQAEGKPLGEG